MSSLYVQEKQEEKASDGLGSLFGRQTWSWRRIKRGEEVVALLHLTDDLKHQPLTLQSSSTFSNLSHPLAEGTCKTFQVAMDYIIRNLFNLKNSVINTTF